MKKKILIILIILILLFCYKISEGKDRCEDYVPDIRQYALQYLGPTYPYWYQVGCAKAESNCRGDITSFDGGQGLFQLTPSTGITAEISKYMPVDPYDTLSSIRAQAYYMHLIRDVKFKSKNVTFKKHKISPNTFVSKCGINLEDVYRFYNSGYWFFYESSLDNYVCGNDEIKKHCVRSKGGIWVGTGKNKRFRSNCEISFEYAKKIYDLSQPYSKGMPDQENYWYDKNNSKPDVKPSETKPVDKPIVKPKEELKPYPGALPPPETIDYNKVGNETFCLLSILKNVNLFGL